MLDVALDRMHSATLSSYTVLTVISNLWILGPVFLIWMTSFMPLVTQSGSFIRNFTFSPVNHVVGLEDMVDHSRLKVLSLVLSSLRNIFYTSVIDSSKSLCRTGDRTCKPRI